MFLVWALFLVWHLTASRMGCHASAGTLALVAALVMSSGTEVAFSRRRAFISHYLDAEGLLFRLLSRKTLTLISQGIKALLLSIFLLVSVLRLDHTQWLLLLADVPVLALFLAGFSFILEGEMRHEYRGLMARHWAARVNATLLWFGFVLLMFFSPQENYGNLRWEEVLAFSAAEPSVGCDSLAVLARLAAVGEALGLWAAQHLFADLQKPAQVLVAWGSFSSHSGPPFFSLGAIAAHLLACLPDHGQSGNLRKSNLDQRPTPIDNRPFARPLVLGWLLYHFVDRSRSIHLRSHSRWQGLDRGASTRERSAASG